MCGIYGERSLEEAPVDRGRVAALTRLLAHRGPDEEGFFFGPGVALGHRRLRVIDLAAGRQPIANEDGTRAIIHDGRVYNFGELRASLAARGHVFTTRTDAEVILHLYEEAGEEAPCHLNGAFAFAIWDGPARRLFFARDRLGEKPLYLRRLGSALHLASEIAPLRALAPAEIDPAALDDFLTYGYVPCNRTIWRGIEQLPPGAWGSFDARGLTTGRYWDLPRETRPCDEAAWLEELRALLDDAVGIRLAGEVPVGAFLSGGIDSSTVVGFMRRRGPVRAFSIGFPAGAGDETDDARRVAGFFGCEHRVAALESPKEDDIVQAVAALGEPFADHSMLPSLLVARMAAREVKVALSGDGADELFGGYQWLTITLRQFARPALARRAAVAAGGALERLCAPSPRGVSLPARVCRYARDARAGLLGAFLRRRSIFAPELKRLAYGDAFLAAIEAGEGPSLHRLARASRGTPGELLDLDLRHYLPGDILVKTDRTGMYHGLEVRAPFLDHRVVEHVAALAPELRCGRGPKHMLKAAVRDLLPAAVLAKRKQGFGLPLGRCLGGGFWDFAREAVLANPMLAEGYLDRRKIEALFAAQRSGREDWGNQLWALLVLSLWRRRVAGGRAEPACQPLAGQALGWQPPPRPCTMDTL